MVAGSKNEEGKDAASNSNLSQAGGVDCVKVSDKGPAQSKMWECSKQCKPLSEFEVNAIVLGQL